jgi:hypothetical protein
MEFKFISKDKLEALKSPTPTGGLRDSIRKWLKALKIKENSKLQ